MTVLSPRSVAIARLGLLVLLSFGLWPVTATAQTAIAGQVKDTTGAVLPGVTVEASSPALIEKVRTAITDDQGRYTIGNLRPGVYALAFSLPGFGTVNRQGVVVPSDVTVPISLELRVGDVSETITVTGEAPTVDVQSAQTTQVLAASVIEALPTSRAIASISQLISGVRMSRPDLAGSNSMEQSYGMVHGTSVRDNGMWVDGLNAKVNNDIGGTQYFNPGMAQELTYQTSALTAENPSGGLRINMIPKDGGNNFSGEFFASGLPAKWQSNNITPALIKAGLKTPTGIEHIIDINPAFGGPLLRDRLWFYSSYRYNSVNTKPAGSFYKDGRPGVEDQYVQNASLRLTWQVNSTHKIVAFRDQAWKFKGHEIIAVLAGGGTQAGVEVETAETRIPRDYHLQQFKWTAALTNRVLLEAGFTEMIYNRSQANQPDNPLKPRFTPAWYAHAQRFDFIRGTATTSVADSYATEQGYMPSFTATYVTGSHNFKTGILWRYGFEADTVDRNADLIQRYRDGVPDSVQVFTTPTYSRESLKADMGIFLQDSWTMNRLTVSPGIRYNYFNNSIDHTCVSAGRFAPDRCVAEVLNVPNWKDWTPRLGAVYDLFGNAKTALKASAGKYMRVWATGVAHRYNPMLNDSDIRNWTDLNGDDIAQDNEIGPSNKATFGVLPPRRPDPNLQREYDWQYSVSLQHELTRRVSMLGAWYLTKSPNLERADNLLISPSDYTPFVTTNPYDNTPITIFNLNRAKQGLTDVLDSNSTINRRTYNGIELSVNARLPRGAFVFGGWSADRLMLNNCDTDDPNQWRFCDLSGEMYQEYGNGSQAPFRHSFKINGGTQLPLGVQFGVSWASFPGSPFGNRAVIDESLNVMWAVPANLFPGGRTQTVSALLIPRGAQWLDRWQELDVSLKKTFKIGSSRIQAIADIFNIINAADVLGQVQTFGPTLGTPTETLQGRMMKLGVRIGF